MSFRKLLGVGLAVGSVLATAPAHAGPGAEVQLTVTPDTDYSACLRVRRTNNKPVSATFSARGYMQQGVATAQINDAEAGGSTTGLVTLCTDGAFTAHNGTVTYHATFQAGAATGTLDVVCVTVAGAMTCGPRSVSLPDPF